MSTDIRLFLMQMKGKLFPCSLCSTILAVLMIESSSSPLNEEHVAHGFVLASVRRPYLVDIKVWLMTSWEDRRKLLAGVGTSFTNVSH